MHYKKNKDSLIIVTFSFALAVILFTCVFCNNSPGAQEQANYEMDDLVSGNTEFALNLYPLLCEKDKNLFFSPYNIYSSLAMGVVGAKNETAQQMTNVLHFPYHSLPIHNMFKDMNEDITARSSKGFKLNIVNSIWGQERPSFLKEFTDVMSENYSSEIRQLDFRNSPEKSTNIINNWVCEKTEGNINSIVPSGVITTETNLILVNAMYFESKWKNRFIKDYTKDDTFYLLDGETVTVPMMSGQSFYAYTYGKDYQAVELDYRVDVSMVIVLPREGCFEIFERSLTEGVLYEILHGFAQEPVILNVPKFKCQPESVSMKEILIGMGIKKAFTSDADFSGIDGASSMFISDILHKASIAVNEGGVGEYADTARVLMDGDMSPGRFWNPFYFTANRPFLFFIRDKKSGVILFMGRILNPIG